MRILFLIAMMFSFVFMQPSNAAVIDAYKMESVVEQTHAVYDIASDLMKAQTLEEFRAIEKAHIEPLIKARGELYPIYFSHDVLYLCTDYIDDVLELIDITRDLKMGRRSKAEWLALQKGDTDRISLSVQGCTLALEYVKALQDEKAP